MAESPRKAGDPQRSGGLRVTAGSTGSPVRRSLLAGAGWVALGVLGSRVITLGAMIGAARLLGQSAFGELCMTQQSVLLFSVVISYGLGLTAAKHLAELQHSNRERAGSILAVVILASLGCAGASAAAIAAVSPLLTDTIVAKQLLFQPLLASVVWLMVSSVSLTVQGALTGLFAFRATAWVQFIEATGSCGLVLIGAASGGLNGAVIGFAAATMSGCIAGCWSLASYASEKGIPLAWPSWQQFVEESGALRDYCLPATLAGLVVAIANWTSPALLVRHSGGYAEIAVFNASNYWFNALIMLPNVLQRVGTVLQAAALGNSDAMTGRAIYRDTVLFNFALIGAAACPLAIGSPWILGLFGPEFREGWPTLVVCLATALCLSVVKPAEQTLNATGRTWTSFGLHAGFATFYVIAGLLLVPFGALGMASARFTAYAIHAVCMSAAARMLYPQDSSVKTGTCDPFSPVRGGEGTRMRAA